MFAHHLGEELQTFLCFRVFQLGDWLKLRAGCQKGQVVAVSGVMLMPSAGYHKNDSELQLSVDNL